MRKNYGKGSIRLEDVEFENLNFPPDWDISLIILSHFTLSKRLLSKSCTFCAITRKWKFAFSTVTTFSRQKPLNSKDKNHTIVWDKKFYNCAKQFISIYLESAASSGLLARRDGPFSITHQMRTFALTFLSKLFIWLLTRSRYWKIC